MARTMKGEINTPRPTIIVDDAYCSALATQRRKQLRKKLRVSRTFNHVIRVYRTLQRDLTRTHEKCSKKEAKSLAEDPDPYEKGYIFYCL
jgi:hypothetical protein